MQKLRVVSTGMVTSVGLNAPASCAAIRCGLDNNQETRFMDQSGEWITGAMVPLAKPWRGLAKMKHLVVPAIKECLQKVTDIPAEKIPFSLCVAEKERPGRLAGLDDQLLADVQKELGIRPHPLSTVIAAGRVGSVHALSQAMETIGRRQSQYCIVAGVDTFLVTETLRVYEQKMRLLTEKNSNGFIPGEAGAAVLVGSPGSGRGPDMIIRGIGFGTERATIESDEPLRADGMVEAFKNVFSVTGLSMKDINYRITDFNGEQYKFKEGDLAVTRTLRDHKGEIDIQHPIECIGEVGAAIVPCILSVAESAARKQYTTSNRVLCHFSNDNDNRAAMILTYERN